MMNRGRGRSTKLPESFMSKRHQHISGEQKEQKRRNKNCTTTRKTRIDFDISQDFSLRKRKVPFLVFFLLFLNKNVIKNLGMRKF